MRRFQRIWIPVLATLALVAATPAAQAAVFTPSKVADTSDGACDTDCSLREAVIAANANPGTDVIVLGPGNYTLGGAPGEDHAASGDLDITDDLVILGAGAVSTSIRGGRNDRIFEVWETSLDLSGVGLDTAGLDGTTQYLLPLGIDDLKRALSTYSEDGSKDEKIYALNLDYVAKNMSAARRTRSNAA